MMQDPDCHFRGARILVVDDDEDNRELLVAILERGGAHVSSAASSAEALSLLEAQRPHVLITDIGLPDEDGFEMMKRIRALPGARGGDIVAIAVTGYGSDEDRDRSRELGFQAHLTKPVDFEQMAAVVAEVLRSRP